MVKAPFPSEGKGHDDETGWYWEKKLYHPKISHTNSIITVYNPLSGFSVRIWCLPIHISLQANTLSVF